MTSAPLISGRRGVNGPLRLLLGAGRQQIAGEPIAGQDRGLGQGSGLFEQMRGTLDDRQLARAAQLRQGAAVQFEYRPVGTADDQQRGGPHVGKPLPGQVRTATARHDRRDLAPAAAAHSAAAAPVLAPK